METWNCGWFNLVGRVWQVNPGSVVYARLFPQDWRNTPNCWTLSTLPQGLYQQIQDKLKGIPLTNPGIILQTSQTNLADLAILNFPVQVSNCLGLHRVKWECLCGPHCHPNSNNNHFFHFCWLLKTTYILWMTLESSERLFPQHNYWNGFSFWGVPKPAENFVSSENIWSRNSQHYMENSFSISSSLVPNSGNY